MGLSSSRSLKLNLFFVSSFAAWGLFTLITQISLQKKEKEPKSFRPRVVEDDSEFLSTMEGLAQDDPNFHFIEIFTPDGFSLPAIFGPGQWTMVEVLAQLAGETPETVVTDIVLERYGLESS